MARPRKTQPVAVNDGYANIVANLGTQRDKAASGTYTPGVFNPVELLNAYTTSWLAAKAIDVPAEDATRKWRSWIAKADQIEKIEALEKRLKLKQRLREALIAARLWGGAAIYINTQDREQSKPLKPGKEIRSLVVLTRNELSAGEIVKDISSDYFGMPEFYTLRTNGAEEVRIHASRLVVLAGRVQPAGSTFAADAKWGMSVLSGCMEAIKQLDSVMANINSLVFEAKVDVFKFKDWATMLADSRNDGLLTRRLMLQAAQKGINGAVVIDAEDDYEAKSASFGGLPEIATKFQEQFSGATGIPFSRIFRRSGGLSDSGDGDERTYYDSIEVLQKENGDAMHLLDECIIWQALGSRPTEVYYEWKPLRQLTQNERADIFSKTASALRALAGGAEGSIIPIDALSDAAVNEFVEQGMLPGLQAAIEKYGSLNEQNELTGGENEIS